MLRQVTDRIIGKDPVIILGMHRSGTTMLVRCALMMGVEMGRELSVNAESLTFQRINRCIFDSLAGRWDNVSPVVSCLASDEVVRRETRDAHRRLLHDYGIFSHFGRTGWVRLLAGHRWGWKDPRNCITLPIWLELFPDARVVHVVRNGVDAAISLHRRETRRNTRERDYSSGCQDFTACFLLWEEYVRAGRLFSSRLPAKQYLELRYEEMLRSPMEQLTRVTEFLNKNVGRRVLQSAADDIDSSRLDNSLYRRQYAAEIAELPASQLMHELGYD